VYIIFATIKRFSAGGQACANGQIANPDLYDVDYDQNALIGVGLFMKNWVITNICLHPIACLLGIYYYCKQMKDKNVKN